MHIEQEIVTRFDDFVFDWDYEKYLVLGGYGSAKSWHVAFKIIMKCLQEKRKVLVVRNVLGTIGESCFALFHDILDSMGILAEDTPGSYYHKRHKYVIERKSPMKFRFPNGSSIIFKGLDNPAKVKSIHGVSILWVEECSEIKYDAYKELLGRLRQPKMKMHFILSCNPVGRENWVYEHFFVRLDDDGNENVILNDKELYEKGTMVVGDTYYHHSIPDDNPFLPASYIKTLDELKSYDYELWRTARCGQFGPSGIRVLPQFTIARNSDVFIKAISNIPEEFHFYGMDFGFEESYNAVISMCVDTKRKYLYIYDEIYKNKVTDDVFKMHPKMQKHKRLQNLIVADNEDPKAIAYYRRCGWNMRKCFNKFAGSRLSNTRKIKRFKKIICSPKCINTIRELRDLTYKKDSKGNTIYDQFNIDPHTFSAIWYGLDTYHVDDLKKRPNYSKNGSVKRKGVA